MGFSKKATRLLFAGVAVSAMAMAASAAYAYNGDPDYLTYDGGADFLPFAGPSDLLGPSGPSLGHGFEGLTQYDAAAFGRNFIPPDTMGAVGTSQFMETTNGAYAVYSKSGVLLQKMSDVAFWAAAGQTGANGDSRVLFDSRSGKWIVESFGASISTIQIAVSNTSDATGGWKSTSFVGFNGIADYPTLAIDDKAVYIGTNDFNSAGTAFKGTTLDVINRDALFGPSGPDASGVKQFFTSLSSILSGNDRGFAIQGVNQIGDTDSGKIIAVGANNFGLVAYGVNNPGTPGATQTAPILLSPGDAYDVNNPAREPNTTGTGTNRIIDPLDDRVSSAVYELKGKIYALHTITPTGTDHTEIQWQVIDAASSTILATGVIGGNGDGFDYYQGSLAVNASGQVVIGYNRSGEDPGTGEVRLYAQTFNSLSGGGLVNTGTYLLKVSETDSYHNGSIDGQPAAGRQRWGDYSQVTVDPTNGESFWIIGEFADEFNDPAHGHPNGTGGSRWGTWISEISVPEPATWSLMIMGFGFVGLAARRRKALAA